MKVVCASKWKRKVYAWRGETVCSIQITPLNEAVVIDEGLLTTQIDNHMINGTKLLNVAGMTRGRRDGILKSEKTRHVVKIGPMHLKGVWYDCRSALGNSIADLHQDPF